jgi:hypothetical protein
LKDRCFTILVATWWNLQKRKSLTLMQGAIRASQFSGLETLQAGGKIKPPLPEKLIRQGLLLNQSDQATFKGYQKRWSTTLSLT